MKVLNTKANKLALLSLTALIMACGGTVKGDEKDLLERIKKLEDRIAELEGKGPAVAVAKGQPWEPWIGATKFSGYVSASYLYNFNRSKVVNGRTFDINHNEFDLDKFKLTLEKAVDFSPTNWDVGYRADLIVGEDAKVIQPLNGPTLGSAADYEQVYMTVNVPVGRGLQVSAGRMVTLLGLEVIEETANPNWSEGNQFIFVENATSTGVQFAYKWTDKIDTQVRVINGWDVVKDNNNALSFMGRIGWAPTDKANLALVGYGGPEQPGNDGAYRKGVDLVASYKLMTNFTVSVQGDYGNEDPSVELANITGNRRLLTDEAEWWAGGLWLVYDFTDKIGVAIRGDYLHDADGARTSASPTFAPFPANSGMDLWSLTGTLNLRPWKNLQVRPEVRWDHSDLGVGAFGDKEHTFGRKNQVTSMVGVAYLF